jgi:uncharacterized membrane protein YdjX (TVP38/TMEM64 family)
VPRGEQELAERPAPETGRWSSRHGYTLVCVALVAVFLAMFVAAEQLRLPLLTDPQALGERATWPAALLGVALLVADVVLPVPASGVMVAQGAAFGFVLGALLSLVGGTGATLAAYLLGRRSRRLINRLVSADQQLRAARMLEKHGMWAIVATRPVPMLAETVAILAGASTGMPWWKVAAAGALGNLLPAVAYAAAGAYAATYVSGLAVFAGVIVLALLAWALPRVPR